ncbi:hypothetical protein [Mycobacterium phage WXIN]|nr:hypothetical protein [Mycobacterium phage WXIN]
MIGADNWILKSGWRPLTKYWRRDIRKMPWRYTKHKYQRLTRGFSDADMWNADGYLADIISATAYWHFVHNKGIPMQYVALHGDNADEEWRSALLDLYEGFRNEGDDIDWHPSAEAFDLLRETFRDLWD